MVDRIKLLVQKRTSLKSQITNLSNLLDKGTVDKNTLEFRIARITVLYNAFEELNDELLVLDPSDIHRSEFEGIQERFITLSTRIKDITTTARASDVNSIASDETWVGNADTVSIVKKRRIKLPETPLPTFDGKFENWLTFKNSFHNVIGSQTDLTEIDKLHYLKAALKGEAANKIKIFAVDGVSITLRRGSCSRNHTRSNAY